MATENPRGDLDHETHAEMLTTTVPEPAQQESDGDVLVIPASEPPQQQGAGDMLVIPAPELADFALTEEEDVLLDQVCAKVGVCFK